MTNPAARGEGTTARPLGPGWWVRALARHERPAAAGETLAPAVQDDGAAAEDRAVRERAITEAAATGGGPGPPAAVPDHVSASEDAGPRPDWCGFVEQAVAAARPPERLPDTDSWREAFAVPFRPFLALVRDRLTDAAGRLDP